MSFSSTSVIHYLQALALQLRAATKHTQALHTALQSQSVTRAAAAHFAADRHVCAMAVTVGIIKSQVVPGDGLSAAIGSLSELVLRAQRRIVLTELGALGGVVAEPDAPSRLAALPLAPFERLEDWISSVAHGVNNSAQTWIDYRDQLPSERLEYRAALRLAHVAMQQLAERSKGARFLRHAAEYMEWPALRTPCKRILETLVLPINIEPDLPLIEGSGRSPLVIAGRR